MPELRNTVGDELRDRSGVLRATFDLNEHPDGLVRERATHKLLGVGWCRETRLHTNSRVQRRSDDASPSELREVH